MSCFAAITLFALAVLVAWLTNCHAGAYYKAGWPDGPREFHIRFYKYGVRAGWEYLNGYRCLGYAGWGWEWEGEPDNGWHI